MSPQLCWHGMYYLIKYWYFKETALEVSLGILKWKWGVNELSVTCGTRSCDFGDFRYIQWWKLCEFHDVIFVSVLFNEQVKIFQSCWITGKRFLSWCRTGNNRLNQWWPCLLMHLCVIGLNELTQQVTFCMLPLQLIFYSLLHCAYAGIILCMHLSNERQRYSVRLFLIG